MSLYDELLESIIYEDSIKEYNDRMSLNEGYSKEDLQDPKTVKKIYDELELKNISPNYRNKYNRMEVLVDLLSKILALPTLGYSRRLAKPLINRLFTLSLALPYREKDKKIGKLYSDAEKMIKKLKKELNDTNDENEKKSIQKDIDGIIKVLNVMMEEERKATLKLQNTTFADYKDWKQ